MIQSQSKKSKILFLEMPGTTTWPFLEPIVHFFEKRFHVKYLKTSNPNLIAEGVQWADMVWLEWANQMAVRATCYVPEMKRKKVICRLHGYEVFTLYPGQIDWSVVDALVFVATHKQDLFNQRFDVVCPVQTIIRNGIDTRAYSVSANKINTKKMVLLGNLNFRKGVPILLQFFHELIKRDREYRLYIRGDFEDPRLELATHTMMDELCLNEHIEFVSWVDDINQWLADKSHILSFSLEESFHYALGEGMAAGLKPVIHAWRESREIWPDEFIFNDLEGFLSIVSATDLQPDRYRLLLEEHGLDLNKQLNRVDALVRRVFGESEGETHSPLSVAPRGGRYRSKPNVDRRTHILVEQGDRLVSQEKRRRISHFFQQWNLLSPYDTGEIQQRISDHWNHFAITTIKCERIDRKYDLWASDMVLEGPENGLVLDHLIYDAAEKRVFAPFALSADLKAVLGKQMHKCVKQPDFKRSEEIVGRIYNKGLLRTVTKHFQEFLWERLYPGTIFAPLKSFYAHMQRYRFATDFLHLNDIVVDAACGLGYGTKYLSRFSHGVFGVDLSPDSLHFAKKFYNGDNIRWLRGDATTIPLASHAVDAFISMETFEHVDRHEEMLSEVHRILNASGVAIFSTPNGGSPSRKSVNNPFHRHEWSYDEIVSLFSFHFPSLTLYGCSSSGHISLVDREKSDRFENFIIVARPG